MTVSVGKEVAANKHIAILTVHVWISLLGPCLFLYLCLYLYLFFSNGKKNYKLNVASPSSSVTHSPTSLSAPSLYPLFFTSHLPFPSLCPCPCPYLCPYLCHGLSPDPFLSRAYLDGDPDDVCYYGVCLVTWTVIVNVDDAACPFSCFYDLHMKSSEIVSEMSCLVSGND